MHHPRSLFSIGQIFADFPHINWLQGFPNTVDEKGAIIHASPVYEVDKFFFYQKKHKDTSKFIQQESTFWRKSLWEKAGSRISTDYRLAGDFELWIRFFQYEKLYNVYGLFGSFRLSTEGQASVENFEKYLEETYKVLDQYPLPPAEKRKMRFRRWCEYMELKLKNFHTRIEQRFNLTHQSVVNHKLYFDHRTQKYKSYR